MNFQWFFVFSFAWIFEQNTCIHRDAKKKCITLRFLLCVENIRTHKLARVCFSGIKLIHIPSRNVSSEIQVIKQSIDGVSTFLFAGIIWVCSNCWIKTTWRIACWQWERNHSVENWRIYQQFFSFGKKWFYVQWNIKLRLSCYWNEVKLSTLIISKEETNGEMKDYMFNNQS